MGEIIWFNSLYGFTDYFACLCCILIVEDILDAHLLSDPFPAIQIGQEPSRAQHQEAGHKPGWERKDFSAHVHL